MTHTKILTILAVTFSVSTLTLRVPHSTLDLQTKITPSTIQPIVYSPTASSQSTSNSNPSIISPPSTNTQQSSTNTQTLISSQPHSISPMLYIPQTGVCTDGKIWDSNSSKCICPADKPYSEQNGQCVSCQAPQFWVVKLSKCMTCPEGFQSDKIEGRCYCPKERPFLDGKFTCQACNTVWDYTAKTCLVCDNKKTFNSFSKKCECPADNFEDAASSCVSCPPPASWDMKNKKCVRCPEGFAFDQNSSQCVCPKEKPYLDGNNSCVSCNGEWDEPKLSCKACQANKTWNAGSKKCECSGQFFDDGTEKCANCPKPASWDITNKKCVRCPEGFQFESKSSQCTCPADKPYLDANNNCQACSTRWDTTALKCEICTFGTTWNNSTQKCDQKCPYPLINGKCQCPSDKPRLDQATQQCKSCEKETPIWNGKQCKACPPNTYFFANSKFCASCVQGMNFNQTTQSCEAVA